MLKFLEKIAINFLTNRGYIIDYEKYGRKYSIIKNDTADDFKEGQPVYINDTKKSVIINLKKNKEDKFVKEFEKELDKQNNINNENELDKLI